MQDPNLSEQYDQVLLLPMLQQVLHTFRQVTPEMVAPKSLSPFAPGFIVTPEPLVHLISRNQ